MSKTFDLAYIEIFAIDEKGRLHCEDSPAFKWKDGDPEWYIHGELLPVKTQVEFERYMGLKAFW